MNEKLYHGMTSAEVSDFLMKLTMEGIEYVRSHLSSFTVKEKYAEYKEIDLVTDIDTSLQDIFLTKIASWNHRMGAIAEEGNYKVYFAYDGKIFVIIFDPVDGTKALARGQSDGIAVMISFAEIIDNQIYPLSGFIGDVMTGEIYGFRPGASKEEVFRMSPYRYSRLLYKEKTHKRLVMLDDVRMFPQFLQDISHPDTGYFDSIDISNGSIGTNMAKIWKGETEAMLLKKGFATPWDITPVKAICTRMGFVMVNFVETPEEVLVSIEPPEVSLDIEEVPYRLIVHSSKVESIIASFAIQRRQTYALCNGHMLIMK